MGVTLTAIRTDSNPHMENSRDMDHWRATLRYQGRRMTLTFSKGFAHKGEPPSVNVVLDCLFSDATCGEDFEDFCANCGYDADSRKAEGIWREVNRQTEKFKALLGSDYDSMLAAERA